MTNSLSEFKRPYSVCPMRAAGDRKLTETDLRVLMALSAFTNRAGVCWPSMATLMDLTDLKSRSSIHNAIKKMKRLKYMRQLEPKDYQKTKTGWKNNRYQVLWEVDMALPSLEEIHIAKPLQLIEDQDDVHESEGGLGDAHSLSDTSAGASPSEARLEAERHSQLAHAFISAIQQATGQVVLFDNVINHARKLASDVTVEQLTQATLDVSKARLAKRQGVPSLRDVAEVVGV